MKATTKPNDTHATKVAKGALAGVKKILGETVERSSQQRKATKEARGYLRDALEATERLTGRVTLAMMDVANGSQPDAQEKDVEAVKAHAYDVMANIRLALMSLEDGSVESKDGAS